VPFPPLRSIQAGNDLRPLLIKSVNHPLYAPALFFFWSIEVSVLVQQHQAFLCLAFAGKEHPLNFGKRQNAIVGMNGL